MYEAFYGLSCKPFQLNPDPAFYYSSKQHRRAKAYLDYGVLRNEGFIVITGEIGAGKTTILRSLLDSLASGNIVVGSLVTTQLGAEDTLRMVGAAFGFRVKDVPKSELLITLEAFLISQMSQGKRCLLVVDEAQNLTARAVEELRMLSNFQFGNQSLLQSFLVGQPEFREILQRPETEQFRQRVAATCHIGPLDLDETHGYIEHRLKCAGSTGKPEFEPAVFPMIFNASGGIPRRINALCDRLLLLGYLGNRTRLTQADIHEVVQEFAQESAVPVHVRLPADLHAADAQTAAASAGADGSPSAPGALLDIDLSSLKLDADAAHGMVRQLDALGAQQQGDMLQRLERSLLRLERINLQTLAMLKKLVNSVQRVPDAAAPAASTPEVQPQPQRPAAPPALPAAPQLPREAAQENST